MENIKNSTTDKSNQYQHWIMITDHGERFDLEVDQIYWNKYRDVHDDADYIEFAKDGIMVGKARKEHVTALFRPAIFKKPKVVSTDELQKHLRGSC